MENDYYFGIMDQREGKTATFNTILSLSTTLKQRWERNVEFSGIEVVDHYAHTLDDMNEDCRLFTIYVHVNKYVQIFLDGANRS